MRNKPWKDYEEVAQFVLHELREELGLQRVEGKQLIAGSSGTTWQVDAKGVAVDNKGVIVVECRRYVNQRLSQDALSGLAYRIKDTGAQGGIIVSPLDLQKGAKLIANHENIKHVRIDPESTTTDYIVRFLNQVFVAFTVEQKSEVSFGAVINREPKPPG